jgi:DNA-binding MarR family transcriptional regulator
LTPLLKRLQAQGLLQRQRNAHDERQVLVQLTEQGQALKTRAASVPPAMACSMACSLQELQQLTTRLTQLRHQLMANTQAATASRRAAPLTAPRAAQTPAWPEPAV